MHEYGCWGHCFQCNAVSIISDTVRHELKKNPCKNSYGTQFTGLDRKVCCSGTFQENFTHTVTPHYCQCQCLMSRASLSRRRSSTRTPCPGSFRTPPCAYAPYGSSSDANFPPSARALYLLTEARSPLDSDHHPSPCRSRNISNVNLQPCRRETAIRNHHAVETAECACTEGAECEFTSTNSLCFPCSLFTSVSFLPCFPTSMPTLFSFLFCFCLPSPPSFI